MNWNNAHFVYSAGIPTDLRLPTLPEIALVGRSNVGKSSLINHLLNHKNLARVSKKPGKTKLINFFDVDETFLLADLPGYGYAAVPDEERLRWTPLVEEYLTTRSSLKLVCLLIDARHPITEDDQRFIQWIQRPLLIIHTKSDLAPSGFMTQKTASHVHYSIKSGAARQFLRTYFERICHDSHPI